MVAGVTTAASVTKDPLDALEKHFGFRKFLDGQSQVVSALLSGRDALVVMPTGGGKSLCYQLPALCLEGVTVVISPLIALMKDQVDALQRKGIPATMINSTLDLNDQRDRIRRMKEGEFKLVYIAPERFRSGVFTEALREVEIALFAIDEAHCLSQWGHDFRPDYLRLGQALDKIGRPQTAAFTATATPEVRADILKHLGLREPFECVSGFSRPNLSLTITHAGGHEEKYGRVRDIIAEHKTGIIYCSTRKRVDEVALRLKEWGVSSVAYHAGMDENARSRAQDLFISKKRDVAVATNAFGMGIDRSDVRFVIHFELPGSVEAYYQEAGRAGRDGEPSVCELLFNFADTRTQEFFIEGNNPGAKTIREVYQYLQNKSDAQFEVKKTLKEINEELELKNEMALGSAISQLARRGYVERFDIAGQRLKGTRLLQPKVKTRDIELDVTALEEKDRRDRDKLKSVIDFSYSNDCRQVWILGYFGEADAAPCGSCDMCRKSGNARDLREATEAETLIVKKALSGVARMSQKTAAGWEGRFGRAKIIQMLVGSRSQDMIAARLDELSTYGLLKDTGTGYLNLLFRELASAGLIQATVGEYPLVTLTDRGSRVMAGKEEVKLRWPSAAMTAGVKPASRSAAADTPVLAEMGFDQRLFDQLKAKRNEIARNEGVPAFVVFSNATLEFFTRLRPSTVEAALRIRGVGENKAAKYAAPFLEIIRSHGK